MLLNLDIVTSHRVRPHACGRLSLWSGLSVSLVCLFLRRLVCLCLVCLSLWSVCLSGLVCLSLWSVCLSAVWSVCLSGLVSLSLWSGLSVFPPSGRLVLFAWSVCLNCVCSVMPVSQTVSVTICRPIYIHVCLHDLISCLFSCPSSGT